MKKDFNNDVRALPDYLAYEQALPDTTSEVGNGGPGLVAAVQGALEVVVEAVETIALTGDLTIQLQDSDNGTDGWNNIPQSVVITNPATVAGEDLARIALPTSTKPYIRVNLTTTATPGSGSVNVFPAHVAR